MGDRPEDGGPSGDVPARGAGELPGGLPPAPECPFCRGEETELMNAFGAHASVASYWCRDCRSPFELLRWRGAGGSGEGRR